MSIELQAQAKSRILIVDDSGMNRMMLSELLEDRYDILEASNGVEALALIRQNLSSLDLCCWTLSCRNWMALACWPT